MLRIPTLTEVAGLFAAPTVARALADLDRTVQRLKQAEDRAHVRAGRHNDERAYLIARTAEVEVLAAREREEAHRAKRVASNITGLIA